MYDTKLAPDGYQNNGLVTIQIIIFHENWDYWFAHCVQHLLLHPREFFFSSDGTLESKNQIPLGKINVSHVHVDFTHSEAHLLNCSSMNSWQLNLLMWIRHLWYLCCMIHEYWTRDVTLIESLSLYQIGAPDCTTHSLSENRNIPT